MPPRTTRSSTWNAVSHSPRSSDEAHSTVARTDGVGNTGGPVVRRRGLGSSITMLGGLKAAYFKATPERFVTSKQIADEIRRLRGHDRSTVYERHAKLHEGDESYPHQDELVSLCKRLINLSYGDATWFAAQKELLALSVEDPVVYELSRVCQPSSVGPSFNIDFFGLRTYGGGCHRRWSELLGRSTFNSNRYLETAQLNCDALKDTFDSYGMAANEYMPYAMGLEMQNDDLVLLHQLWDSFLDYVVKHYNRGWDIKNVDSCFRSIVSSGKPLSYFASPSQLKHIAMFLVMRSTEVPFLFSLFFPLPTFESHDPNDPYGAKLVFHSRGQSWNIVIASTYAMTFLSAYAKHAEDHIVKVFHTHRAKEVHILTALTEDFGSGTHLARTIFAKGENTFIALYKTVYDTTTSYRRAMGVISNFEEYVHDSLLTLVEPSLKSIVTSNSLSKEKKKWDVPRSNFYIAHTVDVDRYYKHEVLESLKGNDAYISVLNDRVRFQTFYTDPEGICSLTYIPQFQNVSYLRRFKIGSRYFITADGLPELKEKQILNFWNWKISPENLRIDTMLLDGHVLTCLRVDEELPAFDCTGHYPILAGLEFETNEPLYIAVVEQEVDSPWFFTTVKDGASSVKYTDEVGEEHITEYFFVLALRHDPTDLPPQQLEHRNGAKDPTGPVYWVEFWPRKDAHYWDDERLRDDKLLEGFLEKHHERKTDSEEFQLQELLSGLN